MDYRISLTDTGKTVGQVAIKVLKVSRSALSRLKFNDGIFLNDHAVHTGQLVKEGDKLSLCFMNRQLPLPLPSAAPLSVLYEDEWLLVVDKPAPLPSISSSLQGGETLQNRVFSYLGAPKDFVYRPVNRLDKGTSGLMIIAKDAHTHQRMQNLLHSPSFVREYLAISLGRPPEKHGTLTFPLGKGEGVRRIVTEGGKPAETEYELLCSDDSLSLVKLRLKTGRTHQIRVHLAQVGCPVLGDYLYGQEDSRLAGRFALHAVYLSFKHPMTGADIERLAPLPSAMMALLRPGFQS